jgi:hypothetical protein
MGGSCFWRAAWLLGDTIIIIIIIIVIIIIGLVTTSRQLLGARHPRRALIIWRSWQLGRAASAAGELGVVAGARGCPWRRRGSCRAAAAQQALPLLRLCGGGSSSYAWDLREGAA